MDLASQFSIRTIAFCGISTGVYGYPLGPATRIALSTVRAWLDDPQNNSDNFDLIVFVTFTERERSCYRKYFPAYFPIPTGETLANEEAPSASVDALPTSADTTEHNSDPQTSTDTQDKDASQVSKDVPTESVPQTEDVLKATADTPQPTTDTQLLTEDVADTSLPDETSKLL